MVMIPKQNLIESAMESGLVRQEDRDYIGMSGLGCECQRKIWLDFRLCYIRFITKQKQRIFNRGDLEEPRIIHDLQEAGMIVSNDQAEMVDDTGHIKGHIDFEVEHVPGAEKTRHLAEVKAFGDKYFKQYVKQGLKAFSNTYWVQIHMYMHFRKLKRCLYIVVNKNTEERNFQRYKFDPDVAKEYLSIGFGILTSEAPPKKIGDKTWFKCKTCDAKDVCHRDTGIRMTCRTCKHVVIEMGGKFSCSHINKELTFIEQLNACHNYVIDPIIEENW